MAAFWLIIAILSITAVSYAFAISLVLGMILMIDNIKIFDRCAIIRQFDEKLANELMKEKNPILPFFGMVRVITILYVGLTAMLMPYWFVIRAKQMITNLSMAMQ